MSGKEKALKAEKVQQGSIHQDHRQRMRDRVENYGIRNLQEHEAMEYLLYLALPRGDTNPLAHRLINTFGSYAAVLEASEEELLTVEGVGPRTARFITALRDLFSYERYSRSRNIKEIPNSEAACSYLQGLYLGEKREKIIMVALDDRCKIIKTFHSEEGLGSSVSVDIGKMIAQALGVGAAGVVISHNHPGGVALPSREDMITTRKIVQAFSHVGIAVLDHIIICEDDSLSLRETQRMPVYDAASDRLLNSYDTDGNYCRGYSPVKG